MEIPHFGEMEMSQADLTRVVRPLRRGQITFPADFHRRLGIDDDTLLELTLRDDRIEIVPVTTEPAADIAWARELHAMFAPVRREAQAMDEAEIDALIDAAVDTVRSRDDA
jgi:bifunctional DNA-binding transcriptional regulator/antitoxin component of YhaV-PrlF toxin-antitoxin module